MLTYMEYLGIPVTIIIVFVAVFLVIQIIGELLEFKGKVVPEFCKIRKYFSRKKLEREAISQIPEMLDDMKSVVDTVNNRNKWVGVVDNKLKKGDKCFHDIDKQIIELDSRIDDIDKKLDKNNDDIMSLIIEGKRNTIIDFASYVVDGKRSVTREQFKRIFRLHDEYEEIIKNSNLTNGEVDIAFRIIIDSYEEHMRNHTFVEDVRGYDSK